MTSCPRPSASAQTSSWPTAPTSPCYFSVVLRSLPGGTPSAQQQRICDCGQQWCLLFGHIQTLGFFNLSKLNVVSSLARFIQNISGGFPGLSRSFCGVFHVYQGPCMDCRTTSSLTQSILPLWYIVTVQIIMSFSV